jgi:hypothetical protein
MGKPEQYVNYATVSVEKAESENEMMLSMITPLAPQNFDDHIVEWRVHLAAMRQRSFSDVPDEVKMLFRQHMEATEMLMDFKARTNNTFAAKLQMLEGFPIYWTPDAPLPQIDPATGLPMPPPIPEETINPLPEDMPIDPAMTGEVLPPEMMPPVPQTPQVEINLNVGNGEVRLVPEINPETNMREWTVQAEDTKFIPSISPETGEQDWVMDNGITNENNPNQ